MRSHLTFILNGEIQRLDEIVPTTTLLQWLRRERRLVGTKEGCAEGDCGACSVVVGRLDADGRVRHVAINACIVFLPMLEGASVTTVEAVAAADGSLHPCQRALVDCHGSQCGFCTPGFVMSLFAMYLNEAAALPVSAIADALAGNLCRCTGYGPIVEAAQRMFDGQRPAGEAAWLAREGEQLTAIQHDETIFLEGDGQRMFLPASEDELALLYLQNPDAILIAGATDAGLWVTKQGRPIPISIVLGRVPELAALSYRPAGPAACLMIGAGITHATAARELHTASPELAELWRRFAGPQVRNAGTVGGNIANGSPIGDLAPALIALGATLHLRCGDARRQMPLEDFFQSYGKQDRRSGEFVTNISVPANAAELPDFRCHKVSKRFDDDISAVCGAFNIRLEGGRIVAARIAFGGMAAVPKRAHAVEAALVGRAWTRPTIDQALAMFEQDFKPITDARASAGYRMAVAKNLLVRTFMERSGDGSGRPIATRLARWPLLADG